MGALNILTPARVYIHSGDFVRLGQLVTASRINRGYKHLTPQQINTATVDVSINDPLLIELLTEDDLGRILVIESDSYPVPWVGAVTTMKADVGKGSLNIRAQGWGKVLSERYLGPDDNFLGTPGSVFAGVVERINEINATGMGLGAVGDPGGLYEVQLGDVSGFASLNKIARETGAEWWVDARANDSGITLSARFAIDRGENRFNEVTLIDGGTCEVTGWTIDSSSQLYASTITGGATSTIQAYGSRPRTTAVISKGPGLTEFGTGAVDHALLAVADLGLRSRHGFVFFPQGSGSSPVTRRHGLSVIESVRGRGTITAAAVAALERSPFASRRMRITCHWGGRGSWDQFRVGNVIRLESETAFGSGYRGPVSIVGVQPFEQGGFCDLTVWVGESDA